MLRKTLIAIAISLGFVVATTTPAQAVGWVANSCAVRQSLHAHVGYTSSGGQLWRFVPCGTGTSGVIKVNAGPNTPFYVNPEGPAAPFCMRAGWYFYPQSNGAVLTPTVRC